MRCVCGGFSTCLSVLNILCELNNITDVIGIITACLGSIIKQLFPISHFNSVRIALISFLCNIDKSHSSGNNEC